MIIENSVALTRYVYNAASQPRIMALFPRKSKKGVDVSSKEWNIYFLMINGDHNLLSHIQGKRT